jgi:hypothetical protein
VIFPSTLKKNKMEKPSIGYVYMHTDSSMFGIWNNYCSSCFLYVYIYIHSIETYIYIYTV